MASFFHLVLINYFLLGICAHFAPAVAPVTLFYLQKHNYWCIYAANKRIQNKGSNNGFLFQLKVWLLNLHQQ